MAGLAHGHVARVLLVLVVVLLPAGAPATTSTTVPRTSDWSAS
jgi:hypothetical protein